MEYKEDWAETKQRYLAWWNHEYFGRCGLAVTAPKANPPDTVPMPPSPESPEQRWYDLDWISQFNARRQSRTYFGGEALPIWDAGYAGVSGIPVFLGCTVGLDLHTGWWNPVLTDPDKFDVKSLKLNKNHPNYEFTMRMLQRAVKEAAGKSLASVGAFGGCGDTLAAVRGTEQLLVDCIERPDEVREAELYLMDMWCGFYDTCYEMLNEVSEGSTCWFPLWAPGKFYAAQNDFAYNIGPDMYREIFLPSIVKQSEFLDYCIYHVDGVDNFRHVEALCEVPGIQALQILPGAGKPSAIHYLETCKAVQAAGKNLWIMLEPHEVEEALSKLSARGLFIHTRTKTEQEARELLKKAEQWSVDRG